jgi:hypothetical protein
MTTQSDLVRTGNRFLQLMADGVPVKDIMSEAGLKRYRFNQAVAAAREARKASVRPIEPEPVADVAWYCLTAPEIRMLHAIRDEIRAADARAIEMERLRG